MMNDESTLNTGSDPVRYATIFKMKNVLLFLLGTMFLTGCVHNYDLTMVNGMKFTHVSKPKLDKKTGLYSFTDIKGNKKSVSASRVVEIAPHNSQ